MSMNDGGGMMELALLFFFLLVLVGGGIFVYCFGRDMWKLAKEIRSDLRKRKKDVAEE